MKKWKKFIIKYCPDIRILRNCMGKLKSYRMATGISMKHNEIESGERDAQERKKLVNKYMNQYAERTEEMRCMFDNYVKKAGIVMEEAEWEETFQDVMFCHFAYGFRADEYFMYGLKEKTPSQRKEYMSDRDMHAFIIYKMNDVVDKDILRNKIKMYDMFKEFYKRDAIGVSGRKDYEKVKSFIKDHPVFVEKAARENCGRGVRLIDTTKDGFSLESYIEMLLQGDAEYLLEEKINQSEKMSQLNASSVNSVRMITFYDGKNVSLFVPHFRVGRNGSFIDNGAAGGLLCYVDEKTGVCQMAVDEFGHRFEVHPDSGTMLTGFQVPEWDQLLELTEKLARKLPTVRFVGWDLAHTDEGWCFIEGNAHAQAHFSQIACGGKRKEMIALSHRA